MIGFGVVVGGGGRFGVRSIVVGGFGRDLVVTL